MRYNRTLARVFDNWDFELLMSQCQNSIFDRAIFKNIRAWWIDQRRKWSNLTVGGLISAQLRAETTFFLVSWTIAKLIISNLKIHEKNCFHNFREKILISSNRLVPRKGFLCFGSARSFQFRVRLNYVNDSANSGTGHDGCFAAFRRKFSFWQNF